MTTYFPPEVKFESVVCDHCGSTDERILFEGPDRLHYLPGRFRVVECLQCGWIRQNPRPTLDTMGYYYPSDYDNYIKATEDEPCLLRQWDRRYGLLKRRWAIEKYQKRGDVLDVGCATGNFLHEMERAGWQVTGIEPNLDAATYAQTRFHLPVSVGTLSDIDLPNDSFDVITMWDVLEHLHTPWNDLKVAARLLREGGLLVLRIPNMESWGARLFGPLWLGWDLPRHLYFIPQQALRSALNDLGFSLVASRCLATSYAAFLLSLQFYLDERFPLRKDKNRVLIGLGRSMPVRLLFSPPFWMLDQIRKASMITVFARKGATHQL